MTNREKYAEQILDVACGGESIALDMKGNINSCDNIDCEECIFNRTYDSNCEDRVKQWANSEYIEKPKISESDKRFLDYLPDKYKWLTRDMNGALYAHSKKPVKKEIVWTSVSFLLRISNLKVSFPMVKWEDEEPWLIEDLKKLEVE